MRDAAMELNASSAVLSGKANVAKLDDHFPLDVITVRVAAGRALASYGQLLEALVEDTQKEQLTKASDRFVTSFKNFGGKTLSDAQYEVLGTAVQKIGGLLVEHKKKEAVQAIVPQVKPDVDKLCDLFISDFSTSGLNLGQQLSNNVDRLKAEMVNLARVERQPSFADWSLGVQAQVLADREGASSGEQQERQETFTKRAGECPACRCAQGRTASIDGIRAARQCRWADALKAARREATGRWRSGDDTRSAAQELQPRPGVADPEHERYRAQEAAPR